MSCKTSSIRPQDGFARCLEDEKLLRWGRVEDVFKPNKCLLGSNFWYSLFLISVSPKFITTSSFLFTRRWHLVIFAFIWLWENHLKSIVESQSSNFITSSIVSAVTIASAYHHLHNLKIQFPSLLKDITQKNVEQQSF